MRSPQKESRSSVRRGVLRGRELLKEASEVYDSESSPIPGFSKEASRAGFSGGALWMRKTLALLRAERQFEGTPEISFEVLGLTKYAICLVGALTCFIFTRPLFPLPLSCLLFVLVFYALEVQMLFVFPLAIDGAKNVFRKSACLMRSEGGTASAIGTVLVLAGMMIFGGVLGRGFVRSWSLGCLAVLLWYEKIRRSSCVDTEGENHASSR